MALQRDRSPASFARIGPWRLLGSIRSIRRSAQDRRLIAHRWRRPMPGSWNRGPRQADAPAVRRGLMKRRSIALFTALVLTMTAASTALAWPPGHVTVATDGCSFSVHIDLDDATPVVGWSVNASTESTWDSGTTILSGSGATDADGVLDLGPFTADPGEYNVVVGDESPVDGSSIVEHFALSCEAATPTPTPVVTPTPTPVPTPTPTGSELGVGGTPPPTGEEEGLTGTPPAGGAVGVALFLVGPHTLARVPVRHRSRRR